MRVAAGWPGVCEPVFLLRQDPEVRSVASAAGPVVPALS